MKRFPITAFALCVVSLASCEFDQEESSQFSNSDELTIDASVGEMSTNKSLKLGTRFDAGDEISVYAWTGSASAVDTANLQVKNSINTLGNDGKWTANPKMLWKDGQSKHYFLGIYPQKAITDFATEEYTLNTADQEASDVLIATNLNGLEYRSSSVPLTFTHVMSVLHVNINWANFSTEPTEAVVKIKAKTNATINYLNKHVTAIGDNSEIILPSIETVDGYMLSYKSVMIPQSGIKEIVICIGGQMFAYVPKNGITLKSGCYTTINMTIRRNEITNGNVSIVDWNEGEPVDADAIGNGESSNNTDPSSDPTITPSGELTELGKTFEAIDLGLPSGLRWASFNIGAAKPEEAGDLYAWGETETKEEYTLDNYQFYKSTTMEGGTDDDGFVYGTTTISGYTKYCPIHYEDFIISDKYGYNGYTDELTILELIDDVANVKLGGNWRIPTKEEWEELYIYCDVRWGSFNGVNGYKMTGPNGNHIFLPTTIIGTYNTFNDVKLEEHTSSYGEYWSSSVCDESSFAYHAVFSERSFYACENSKRENGRSIRPVCTKE